MKHNNPLTPIDPLAPPDRQVDELEQEFLAALARPWPRPPASPPPSLAQMAADLDGLLDSAERETFKNVLIASQELVAEVETLQDRLAALLSD